MENLLLKHSVKTDETLEPNSTDYMLYVQATPSKTKPTVDIRRDKEMKQKKNPQTKPMPDNR